MYYVENELKCFLINVFSLKAHVASDASIEF